MRNLRKMILFFIMILLLLFPHISKAEVQRVEADGFYVMGDGMEESQGKAKERARNDAKRAVSEKAATYVESLSVVKNGLLTRDEIFTMSAQILKIESVVFNPYFSGNSIGFKCHMVAIVDSSNVTEKLWKDRRKLEEATSINKQLRAENERIKQEMDELKSKFAHASEDKKADIRVEVKKNERDLEAMEWIFKGDEYRFDNIEKSLYAYKQAISYNPQNDIAWYKAGKLLLGDCKYDNSIYFLEKATELNPYNTEAWHELGYAYANLQLYDKAVERLQKAVDINPKNSRLWAILGEAYGALNNMDKYYMCYRKALEYDPNNWAIKEILGMN